MHSIYYFVNANARIGFFLVRKPGLATYRSCDRQDNVIKFTECYVYKTSGFSLFQTHIYHGISLPLIRYFGFFILMKDTKCHT